jgi:hypothetical protein
MLRSPTRFYLQPTTVTPFLLSLFSTFIKTSTTMTTPPVSLSPAFTSAGCKTCPQCGPARKPRTKFGSTKFGSTTIGSRQPGGYRTILHQHSGDGAQFCFTRGSSPTGGSCESPHHSNPNSQETVRIQFTFFPANGGPLDSVRRACLGGAPHHLQRRWTIRTRPRS